MVKNAFALQTVQTEKESALMQNGYSQKKYQHALYGIRISVVMPNSEFQRDQRKLLDKANMKYYRIENDVESKAVGRKYPQLECNTLGYAHAIPDFGPSKIKYNLSFNLVKGTKLTDALSTTAISASGFIISKRLRTLLESYKLERHEFIPVEIIDGKQTHNYYFLHFYGLDMVHCLDYQQSEFHIIKWGFQDLGTKKFDSYESYQNYMKEFNEEYSLIAHLDCVVLKEEFNDLDVFSFPYFGNEVFISERLKQCLEDNHITGFSFEEKFQLYKVTDLLKL